MQEKEFFYQGKKLFYRIKGEGPLVILLHGFGEDGTIWKNQYNLFTGYQLLIPDLPGSGKSEMIEDMSMEGMAEAVKEMAAPLPPKGGLSNAQTSPVGESIHKAVSLQSGPAQPGETPPSEGLGEAGSSQSELSAADSLSFREGRGEVLPLQDRGAGAIIIGHSMGGYIALAFAEKYPGALSGLGLFHSTAYADSETKKETRRKGIGFIQQQGAYEFLKSATQALFSGRTKENKPLLIEEQLESSRNFSREALVSYYEAMMQRPDRTVVLKNSGFPVLFIMGREDKAVPLEEGLKLCHLPQVSYIHILEASAHNGMIEEPDEANKILSQFMKTVQQTAFT